MSPFHSLDELVQAGETLSPPNILFDPAGEPLPPIPQPQVSAPKFSRRIPRSAKRRTRLTGTPDFASPVNQNAAQAGVVEPPAGDEVESQVVTVPEVMAQAGGGDVSANEVAPTSAGGQESEKPVNHTQVVVPQEFPDEIRQQLAQIGVNLRESQLGRKYVLDAFMRGRLVSLLAMGLTLRQSASALGLSHNAIWKELKKNAELSEQVNAARFQAQIEPLLVILRESKRSWRAATWLINYLSKSVGAKEQTPDERALYAKEESRENARYQAEESANRHREHALAHRKVTRELMDSM